MLLLDTEKQKAAVSIVESACHEIETAVNKMALVQSHSDWNCKERKTINSHIDKIKKDILLLQDNANAFFGVLKNCVEQLDEEESGLINDMQLVEIELKKAISIVNGFVDFKPEKIEYVIDSGIDLDSLHNSNPELPWGVIEPLVISPFPVGNFRTER